MAVIQSTYDLITWKVIERRWRNVLSCAVSFGLFAILIGLPTLRLGRFQAYAKPVLFCKSRNETVQTETMKRRALPWYVFPLWREKEREIYIAVSISRNEKIVQAAAKNVAIDIIPLIFCHTLWISSFKPHSRLNNVILRLILSLW